MVREEIESLVETELQNIPLYQIQLVMKMKCIEQFVPKGQRASRQCENDAMIVGEFCWLHNKIRLEHNYLSDEEFKRLENQNQLEFELAFEAGRFENEQDKRSR